MSRLTETCLRLENQKRPQLFTHWHEQENRCERISGAAFFEQVNRMASALQKKYPAQSRILLLFEPGLGFPLAFWACLKAGMVAVPTYPPADPRTRQRFLEIAKDAQASAVLTSEKILKKFQWIRYLLSSLRRMKWHALEELCQEAIIELAPAKETDLALLQYTSGSTASPRGVMLSHANVYANASALAAPWKLMPAIQEHFVSWLPLYHDMGLMCGVIFPLYTGAASTLFSPLYFLQKPRRWLQVLSETQGTISAAPNFAYELCLKKITPDQLEGLDLSNWRVTLNGAEAIQAETLQAFSERFSTVGFKSNCFYNAYGLAETTVFVAGGKPLSEPRIHRFSSQALSQNRIVPDPEGRALVGLGQVWEDTQLQIVNPDSLTTCAENEIGEIWLQGSSVGMGYWHKTEQTEATFSAQLADHPEQGKWLRTGDLGFVYQGDLFITGRIKELIILQGQNHSPPLIEKAVQTASDAFRKGCGAAFSTGEAPERLILVQEIKKDCSLSHAELEKIAKKALAESEGLRLDILYPIEAGSLPKTSSGKIQRNQVKQLYLKGKLKAWKK